MSVIAPFNLQGGRIEPYVSLDEVKFSPTASAIDFSNLVENGGRADQDRALSELIVRASAKADRYTMGKYGTLNATSNTENGRYRANRYGQFIIHPYFTPILELQSFYWGPDPSTSFQIPLAPYNCSIERESIIVTMQGGYGYEAVSGLTAIVAGPLNGEQFIRYTYVNGWANSFTTASVSAGSTSVTVLDATGIYPNQFLMLWDGVNDEYVQVASVSGNVVTFQSPTQYNHGQGCNLSALPAEVKQAVIHFVVALCKQRGQGGLVLSEQGELTSQGSRAETSSEDELLGYDLLDEYRSVWGRS